MDKVIRDNDAEIRRNSPRGQETSGSVRRIWFTTLFPLKSFYHVHDVFSKELVDWRYTVSVNRRLKVQTPSDKVLKTICHVKLQWRGHWTIDLKD